MGSTIDDAAGEAFDKIARLLQLPFPGGPWIDREARSGDANAIDFPRGLTSARDLQERPYDFSFSGVKTAVARWIAQQQQAGHSISVPDVAASFQEAVVDVLMRKAVSACRDTGIEHLVIGGGVAANGRLREMAALRCAEAGINLRIPRPQLCTDNGAMIAALGSKLMRQGAQPSPLGFPTLSVLPVSTVLMHEQG